MLLSEFAYWWSFDLCFIGPCAWPSQSWRNTALLRGFQYWGCQWKRIDCHWISFYIECVSLVSLVFNTFSLFGADLGQYWFRWWLDASCTKPLAEPMLTYNHIHMHMHIHIHIHIRIHIYIYIYACQYVFDEWVVAEWLAYLPQKWVTTKVSLSSKLVSNSWSSSWLSYIFIYTYTHTGNILGLSHRHIDIDVACNYPRLSQLQSRFRSIEVTMYDMGE